MSQRVPEKDQNSSLLQLPGRIWSTIHRSIFEPPKTLWEAVWRVLSVSMATGFLTSAVMVWRYPDFVRRAINHDQIENEIILDIFERHPEIKAEAMEMIATYISTYGPSNVSLVNWETQTGIHQVWASSSTRYWPTATDGVMSPNMREVVGYLVFNQCFVGDLAHRQPHLSHIVGEENWVVCGLANDHDLWGYIIVNWDGAEPPAHAVEALRVMTSRLENIIFEG